MVTNEFFYAKYGDPADPAFSAKWLATWTVPIELHLIIPKRVYCHKDLRGPLLQALTNLVDRGLQGELKTWDGCYNFRPVRGYEAKYKGAKEKGDTLAEIKYLSVHSWGCAIDVNAATNALGKQPTLSAGFVKCFTDAGFDWGGTWKRLDGMHFQLAKLP